MPTLQKPNRVRTLLKKQRDALAARYHNLRFRSGACRNDVIAQRFYRAKACEERNVESLRDSRDAIDRTMQRIGLSGDNRKRTSFVFLAGGHS